MCGGTPSKGNPFISDHGLSPRVRGNHAVVNSPNENSRSIPACAGEPLRLDLASPSFPVYPRVCGGTRPLGLQRRRPTGLSPRVRGNPSETVSRQTRARSIPACAGEPKRASSRWWLF